MLNDELLHELPAIHGAASTGVLLLRGGMIVATRPSNRVRQVRDA